MKVQIQATSKLLVIIALIFSAIGLKAQNISHIETAKSWYYIYDAKGKKDKAPERIYCRESGVRYGRYLCQSGRIVALHLE
ncbi:MAG: hypothetical protein IJ914_10335 [Prevotella sp.]|nr:hypothetical protein [Prevotella sp.]